MVQAIGGGVLASNGDSKLLRVRDDEQVGVVLAKQIETSTTVGMKLVALRAFPVSMRLLFQRSMTPVTDPDNSRSTMFKLTGVWAIKRC